MPRPLSAPFPRPHFGNRDELIGRLDTMLMDLWFAGFNVPAALEELVVRELKRKEISNSY